MLPSLQIDGGHRRWGKEDTCGQGQEKDKKQGGRRHPPCGRGVKRCVRRDGFGDDCEEEDFLDREKGRVVAGPQGAK